MVASEIDHVYFLRFAICAASTEREHVDFAWSVIKMNYELLESNESIKEIKLQQ